MKKNIFFLLLFFQSALLSAQQQEVTRFFELGLSANSYKGDLSSSFDKWTSSVHLGMRFNRKERLNGRFGLMAGNVTGENRDYEFIEESGVPASPNKFFNTRLISLNYDLNINLIKTNNFILYFSQGIGLLRFNPRDANNEKLEEKFNTRARNELYNNISFIFPTNLGVMYILPNHYALGFQAGFMNPSTDYIDNISQWGHRDKKDNILMYRLTFYAPLTYKNGEPSGQPSY